ncbi:MAG: CBS domain-containing protein [Gammaproteobacteria bacterium]
MATFTHTLTPLDLAPGTPIRQASRRPLESVTPASPALVAMTDLRQTRPVTVSPATSVTTALSIMIHANVRLLLVLDDAHAICGPVGARDLGGEHPLRIAAAARMPYEQVTVGQVMTGIDEMRPLDFAEVRAATVRDVVRHLATSKRQHVLVLERDGDGGHVARGIFSATQIGRQLGTEVAVDDGVVHSFAELERLIA